MLWTIIQITLISFIFIIIAHNLINYFINLLTYPKEKEDFHFLTQLAPKEQICIGNEIVEQEINCIDMNCTDIHSLPTCSFLKDENKDNNNNKDGNNDKNKDGNNDNNKDGNNDKNKDKETSMKDELKQFLQTQLNSSSKPDEAHRDMFLNNLL